MLISVKELLNYQVEYEQGSLIWQYVCKDF